MEWLTVVIEPCSTEPWIGVIDDKVVEVELSLELAGNVKACKARANDDGLPERHILLFLEGHCHLALMLKS